MGIGTIMFGKAVVLAVWALGATAYKTFKARRRAAGISLQFDARRGVYYDPIVRFEKRVKATAWVAGSVWIAFTLFVVWCLFTAPPMVAPAG